MDDYKEILRYANDRHIEVIPEFDMPGHCRAGVKAMEARFRKYLKYGDEAAAGKYLMTDFADTTRYLSVQMFTDNTINVCMDSTAAFIRYVIQSVKAMHKDIQPLQTYHFGGKVNMFHKVKQRKCQLLRTFFLHELWSINRLYYMVMCIFTTYVIFHIQMGFAVCIHVRLMLLCLDKILLNLTKIRDRERLTYFF